MISACMYDSNFYWGNIWVLCEHAWPVSANVNRKKKKKSHKGSSIITSLCAILALQLRQSGKQTQMSEVHKHGVQGNFHNQNHEQAVTAIKPKWQCQYLHSYLGS